METLKLIVAALGVIAVVVLLIKKFETKTVLIGVGLILCVLSLKPMLALGAFTSYMTKAGLIKAICASMGFAFVMKYTKCDKHLVKLLTNPLRNIGFLLIPLTVLVTYFINIAIPSASGCSAAVGATLIPLLMASGVRADMAAAAVFAGTFGGVLSPGSAHNNYITDLVKKTNPEFTVQEVIKVQLPSALVALVVTLFAISVVAYLLKDYQKGKNFMLEPNLIDSQQDDAENGEPVNYLYAVMPLVPLFILIVGATSLKELPFLAWTNMGVAEAMILGAILTIFVTLTNPQHITKEFFNGMGKAYANVIGIIIAAGVFVVGLKSCGAIDAVIEVLKSEQEYVKFGGTFVPFLMGMVTGSGDAAAFAFNQAVTVKATELGFDQATLGMAVAIAGALGRTASPIAGACIVCAGIAGANPIQIAKRTGLGMLISICVIAFIIL
ncbi:MULTISPECIES: C4-dicarboxylate transporter DcuC [Pasteurellaceae]|uniref:C4-dicarboxylate transporter DcuC n=1 Tax=Pasteurella atlantica TaxID=2827233 RepID=A0AAW8CMP6_9PAST|nr:C4-dicarboxylate transporter DcuC [Pasteurella atlantica]MBR0573450.1 C4-dicarboxylate transporter DcuC [Pasteurella atlantica]MDP8039451.1 C4-dicarboxylate transporter DcuC [Pasteurella atlantica]MDP8041542.1 C4-dicarboxylate transporter DcuC [Pasteurella atlantica]MDP8043679.1 C4-dicarboxylate transporter DcuC [Pasteurella atlantica]MDP8045824.1 C4-dicarboxylate transporter DcuC [Pasteurella atlantica]